MTWQEHTDILLSLYVCKQTFHIFPVRITLLYTHKCCYNAKPSAYFFYVKTKMSVDFQICISVPLCFVMTFWSCRKNGLIRKTWLTSKFMTSQPGSQTIAIHILFNISQSKGNQIMKLRQLIEHNKKNIFLQKLCRKWVRELVPDLFLFF